MSQQAVLTYICHWDLNGVRKSDSRKSVKQTSQQSKPPGIIVVVQSNITEVRLNFRVYDLGYLFFV